MVKDTWLCIVQFYEVLQSFSRWLCMQKEHKWNVLLSGFKRRQECGPVRELNPGPLAPKARIMPLDQQASPVWVCFLIFDMHVFEHNEMAKSKWIAIRPEKLAPLATWRKKRATKSKRTGCLSFVCFLSYPTIKVRWFPFWNKIELKPGLSGSWTRDLSHPKRESCH